ncbi:MAG: GIY-YIG nuclease family protein [Elusimicrobia bacterium]|nr:GIY-YIG nuclease family protein [Elusimicrobiota bacterium]
MKKHSKFYLYMVECSDGTYYTGYTNDIGKRLERHNRGLASRYTRSRLPVKLVWKKQAENKSYAMKIERKIKNLKRKDKIKLISGSRLDNILGDMRCKIEKKKARHMSHVRSAGGHR